MAEEVVRPLAEGDLSGTPLAHVLLHIFGRELSGTLVVTANDGREATVRFSAGRPQAARFSEACLPDLQAAIVPLCGVTQGRYAFHSSDMLKGSGAVLRGSVDPLTLVAESVRHHARTEVADALLARYGAHPMRLLPGQPVNRLRLSTGEETVIEVLRAGPDTVGNLLSLSPLPERDTRNLLYLLVITRMVAPYGRTSAESHVRMASVSPPATDQGVEAGARSTPQQRIPMREPSDAVRSLMRHASLTPSPFPAVSGRVSMTPRPSAPPRATTEYQVDPDDPDVKYRRAEKRLLAGRPEDALFLAEELLHQDPKSARFLGLRAYALISCNRSSTGKSVGPEISVAIQEALVADENESRALYAKGLAFNQMGKIKNALHFFRRASAADPSFIPAKRDAHLAEMRLRGAR